MPHSFRGRELPSKGVHSPNWKFKLGSFLGPSSHKLHYHPFLGYLEFFLIWERCLLKYRCPPLPILYKFPFQVYPVKLEDSLCNRFIKRRLPLYLGFQLPSYYSRSFLLFRLLFPKYLYLLVTRFLIYLIHWLFPIKRPECFLFKPGLLLQCSRYEQCHYPSMLFQLGRFICVCFKSLQFPLLIMPGIHRTRRLLFYQRPILLPSKFGLFL